MKRYPGIAAAAALLIAMGSSWPAMPAPDAGLPADLQAEIDAATKGDLAGSMNATVDNAQVMISAGALRALQAIERYRRRVQWKQLTPAERNFDNFSFQIRARDQTMWLGPDERETCYEIVLWPRYLPGEKVYIDVPAKLGRSAVYAVRRADARVIRAALSPLKPGDQRRK